MSECVREGRAPARGRWRSVFFDEAFTRSTFALCETASNANTSPETCGTKTGQLYTHRERVCVCVWVGGGWGGGGSEKREHGARLELTGAVWGDAVAAIQQVDHSCSAQGLFRSVRENDCRGREC